MSRLRQIQLRYEVAEDRVLLRINTTGREEFLFWITRRYARVLWPVLMKMLKAETHVREQAEEATKQSVLSFQHEHAIQQTDFQTSYKEDAVAIPLGSEPILLERVQWLEKNGGGSVVRLSGADNRGIEFAPSDQLLHSFCKLLADTAAKADWDLLLELAPHAADTAPVPQSLN